MIATCKRGHQILPENSHYDKYGHRRCSICRRMTRKSGSRGSIVRAQDRLTVVIELPRRPGLVVTSLDVISAVAYDFGITARRILSRDRTHLVMLARRTVCYVLHKRGSSYPQIGRWLGIDHSSVIHAVREFERCAAPQMWTIAERYILRSEAAA